MRPDGTNSTTLPWQVAADQVHDPERDVNSVYLTNSVTLPPLSVTNLYRAWLRVELFFKWFKQHLRIKSFFGVSDNAVKNQVRIAVSACVIDVIINRRLNIDESFHTILQSPSITTFEKTTLNQLLDTAAKQIPLEQSQ